MRVCQNVQRVASRFSARPNNCIDCHMPLLPSKVITFRTSGSELAQRYRTHKIAVYADQAPTHKQAAEKPGEPIEPSLRGEIFR
jgi:hypothetical protein